MSEVVGGSFAKCGFWIVLAVLFEPKFVETLRGNFQQFGAILHLIWMIRVRNFSAKVISWRHTLQWLKRRKTWSPNAQLMNMLCFRKLSVVISKPVTSIMLIQYWSIHRQLYGLMTLEMSCSSECRNCLLNCWFLVPFSIAGSYMSMLSKYLIVGAILVKSWI